LVVALTVGLGGRVQAQQTVRFDLADSVLAIRVGQSASLVLSSDCWVGSYDITLFFDGSRVQLTGAEAIAGGNLPAPTVSAGADTARLVASGTAPFLSCQPNEMAKLTLGMLPGATTGSLVTIRINTLSTVEGADATDESVAGLLDVCQALHTWGDLDDNVAISSRDALIALTAAVGLPTPGFDPAPADVDRDGQVTARDALFILSAGIGIEVGGSRAGEGIANRCAPLAPAPSDMLYWTDNGLTRVNAGDTIPVELGIFGNSTSPARFSPGGEKIVYVCNSGNNHICTVDRDGGNLHDLLVGNGQDANHPVWSPDGLKIAFIDIFVSEVTARSIITVDSTGANPFVVTTSTIPLLELGGWSGSGLVYTSNPSGVRRLNAINGDGTGGHEVVTSPSFQSPSEPAWSPAADAIVFHNGLFASGSIFTVSASGGTITRMGQLIGLGQAPSWLPAGIAFSSGAFGANSEVVLRVPSGRYFRLTRTTLSGGVSNPTFRGPPAP
jgi:hypothetical protein